MLGEIIAGILLGPTVLGRLAPAWQAALFPSDPQQSANAIVLSGLVSLSVVLFLLVAGMEADLSTLWRRRATALVVGIAGIVVPFALGFAAAYVLPEALGYQPGVGQTTPLVFALFLATALSITALPVIIKTLMDLNLYSSELGMVIVASAVFNDLVGWIIFAVILASIGGEGGVGGGAAVTIGLTLGFAALMLSWPLGCGPRPAIRQRLLQFGSSGWSDAWSQREMFEVHLLERRQPPIGYGGGVAKVQAAQVCEFRDVAEGRICDLCAGQAQAFEMLQFDDSLNDRVADRRVGQIEVC